MGINQCIVFDLPSGAGGMAASMYNGTIRAQLKELHKKYGLAYKSKTKGYKFKIWFEKESDYTLFFLVYNFPKQWRRPYIITEEY